ncbi:hypothetical protein B0H14DRAFT_3713210, partial [Mycena olivaceomarginata]
RFSTTAKILISAIGILELPKFPNIAGASSFKGDMFHSARWDTGVDLRGKKVAMIGNGASATQFVPVISQDPTPSWFFAPIAKDYIVCTTPKEQLKDLVPTYSLGCKRMIFDTNFLGALHRPNLKLNWDGIQLICEDGIINKKVNHGEKLTFDVLIFATGFTVSSSNARGTGLGWRETPARESLLFLLRSAAGLDLGFLPHTRELESSQVEQGRVGWWDRTGTGSVTAGVWGDYPSHHTDEMRMSGVGESGARREWDADWDAWGVRGGRGALRERCGLLASPNSKPWGDKAVIILHWVWAILLYLILTRFSLLFSYSIPIFYQAVCHTHAHFSTPHPSSIHATVLYFRRARGKIGVLGQGRLWVGVGKASRIYEIGNKKLLPKVENTPQYPRIAIQAAGEQVVDFRRRPAAAVGHSRALLLCAATPAPFRRAAASVVSPSQPRNLRACVKKSPLPCASSCARAWPYRRCAAPPHRRPAYSKFIPGKARPGSRTDNF